MLHFACIGAQKCGTTWLHARLSEHPGISFPAGKEVHFWNKHRPRGIGFYRDLFAINDGRQHGDVTPAYAILPPPVIEECHHAFPDLRLIYIMRNPIDRAWSHATMDACAAGLNPAELPDQWFLDHFFSPASMQRGDYESCLSHWTSIYPADHFLLLYFEDLQQDPATLLAKCCRHLGLETIHQPGDASLAHLVNPGAPRRARPAADSVLRELYIPKINSLSRFLQRGLAIWLA